MTTQYLDFQSLAGRIKNVILNPKKAWPGIDSQPITNKEIILKIVLPLTALAAVISLLIIWLTTYLTFGFAVKVAFIRLLLPMVTIVAAAIITNELAETFDSVKNLTGALKLIAYSATPWLLANIVVSLLWTLSWLTIFGLYGIYLIYTGLPVLMKTPEDKKPVYTLAVVVLIFVIQLILSAIFGIDRVDL